MPYFDLSAAMFAHQHLLANGIANTARRIWRVHFCPYLRLFKASKIFGRKKQNPLLRLFEKIQSLSPCSTEQLQHTKPYWDFPFFQMRHWV